MPATHEPLVAPAIDLPGPGGLPSVEGAVRLFEELQIVPRNQYFFHRLPTGEPTACALGIALLHKGHTPLSSKGRPDSVLANAYAITGLAQHYPLLSRAESNYITHGFDAPRCAGDSLTCVHRPDIHADPAYLYGQAIALRTWAKESAGG